MKEVPIRYETKDGKKQQVIYHPDVTEIEVSGRAIRSIDLEYT